MLNILQKRLVLLQQIIFNKSVCEGVPLGSCLESVFQLYGYKKWRLKKKLYLVKESGHNKVTINGVTHMD